MVVLEQMVKFVKTTTVVWQSQDDHVDDDDDHSHNDYYELQFSSQVFSTYLCSMTHQNLSKKFHPCKKISIFLSAILGNLNNILVFSQKLLGQDVQYEVSLARVSKSKCNRTQQRNLLPPLIASYH